MYNIKITAMKTRHIFLAIALFSAIMTGCYTDPIYIEGNGVIVTKTLDLDPFTGIVMQGAEDVDISYGEVQEVTVTGDENIISMIKQDVHDGTWYMKLEQGHYRNYDLKYYITLPRINYISNEGLARVVVNNFVNQGDLEVILSGAGRIELNRMENTENLWITIDGLGSILAYGEFPSLVNLDLLITGSGKFLGYPVVSENCIIDITGTGMCEVSATDYLDVIIEGAGIVHYKGYPEVHQSVSGIASVVCKN